MPAAIAVSVGYALCSAMLLRHTWHFAAIFCQYLQLSDECKEVRAVFVFGGIR